MFVENRLLAALLRKDYQRLHAHMERVPLSFAEVLYEPGDTLREVYFVNDGIVSLLSRVENGAGLEVGMVGNEGMVGLSVFLGADTTFCRAMVQATGSAMRMNADWFQKDLRQTGPLQRLLNRYTYALLIQAALSATCSRFHRVEPRLARWLLMVHDRIPFDEVRVTQEFISSLLGVRRERLTEAASALQKRNLIRYSRGHIQILDRVGLEAASCTCYGITKGCGGFLPSI